MSVITNSFPSFRRISTVLGALGILAAGGLALGVPIADVEAKDLGVVQGVEAGARVDAETYSVQIVAPLAFEVGKQAAFEIVIKPKDKFKVNMQYPFKFKLAEPPPDKITFEKTTLVRADGQFSEKMGVMKLLATPTAAGSYKIVGKLALSVCSDANCVMDKVELEITVDAR